MSAKLWEVATNNAFSTTLNGNVTAIDTTITLTSTSGLVAPGVLVIDRVDGNNVNTPLMREYITYTGINGNDVTGVSRGVAGSTDQTHLSGAQVEEPMSVTHWGDLIDFLAVSFDAAGHLVTSTATITSMLNVSNASIVGLFPSSASGAMLTSNYPNPPVFASAEAAQRVVTTTDDATAVIDCTITDQYQLSAVANATEFTVTGTPTDGQKLIIRYKDAGAAKALTFTGFTAMGATIPTTTVQSKWGYVGAVFNSAANTWHVLAASVEA